MAVDRTNQAYDSDLPDRTLTRSILSRNIRTQQTTLFEDLDMQNAKRRVEIGWNTGFEKD
jgi:hypothetical protein